MWPLFLFTIEMSDDTVVLINNWIYFIPGKTRCVSHDWFLLIAKMQTAWWAVPLQCLPLQLRYAYVWLNQIETQFIKRPLSPSTHSYGCLNITVTRTRSAASCPPFRLLSSEELLVVSDGEKPLLLHLLNEQLGNQLCLRTMVHALMGALFTNSLIFLRDA